MKKEFLCWWLGLNYDAVKHFSCKEIRIYYYLLNRNKFLLYRLGKNNIIKKIKEEL